LTKGRLESYSGSGWGGIWSLALYRLLQRSAFAPEDIRVMSQAYEDALRGVPPNQRDTRTKELLAKKVIEVAQTGERDPARMRRLALKAFRSASPERA
jgi:hypothetical protein